MVVSLVLVWPLAVFATGKTSASSQLTPIVSSPAATPVVKQMGPSLPLSASLQTPTQSQQYAMPLTGVISARSVQSQYPVQQSVTGKNVQHKRSKLSSDWLKGLNQRSIIDSHSQTRCLYFICQCWNNEFCFHR